MVYYFAIGFSIIFVLIILNFVRKDKLDEKYSVLWMIMSIVILIVSIFPVSIEKVSEFLGIYYPPSMLFLVALVVMGAYIVHITLTITKQNKMIIKLNQEVAILKEKYEKEK